MSDQIEAAEVEAPEVPVSPPEPVHSDMAEVKEISEAKRQEAEAREAADKIAKKDEKADEKKPISVRDAVRKAEADLKAKAEAETQAKEDKPVEAKPEADPKAEKPAEKPEEAKPEAKAGTEAKPEAKDTTGFKEAPRRFSEDAKAVWDTAPDPVKAETHRALTEMEQGIEKYRQVMEPLKPYMQLANQHGVRIEQAMENYTNLERTLQQDPERGLQMVADYAGIDLREYASRLLNQTPEEVQGGQEQTIRELRGELQQMKQQLGGISQTFEQQRISQTEGQVREFAAQHPRFDEIAGDIEFFLESGRTNDLSEAYQLAERLNPAPAPAFTPQPVASQPAAIPEAQTLKGEKSISGAPANGSSPAARPPSKSIGESLRRAAALAG